LRSARSVLLLYSHHDKRPYIGNGADAIRRESPSIAVEQMEVMPPAGHASMSRVNAGCNAYSHRVVEDTTLRSRELSAHQNTNGR